MRDRLAVALCLALLFVWSLPGTITLRTVLLLAALALLTGSLARADFRAIGRAARLPLWLTGALTLWFVVQASLVSSETAWALGELRGQWLPSLLALALGMLLGRKTLRPDATAGAQAAARLATGIVLVLSAQAFIAVGQSLWHWHTQGNFLRQEVPLTGGKLEMSFVLNLLLTLLTVELYCRATHRPRILRLPLAALLAILGVALFGSYFAGARNGMLGFLFLAVAALALFAYEQRHRLKTRKTLIAAGIVVAVLAAFALAHLRAEPRWQTFMETTATAWDIDSDTRWLDVQSIPWRSRDGRPVDRSAWLRVAFIHAGLRQIGERPLGVGYGRNAFAHALKARYPTAVVGHAHSGWIDLGIAGGIPALLLWGALAITLLVRGWTSFFARNNAHGLILFFVAAGYTGRMALDSINKDHMLQMFMFLAGLLLLLSAPAQDKESR